MPRLKYRVPSYRRHKVTGQAVVTLAGKDHYLGSYGTPESRENYQRLVSEWLATPWGGGRHARRVALIADIEERQSS